MVIRQFGFKSSFGGQNEVLVDISNYFDNGGVNGDVRVVVEKEPKSQYDNLICSIACFAYIQIYTVRYRQVGS